MRCLLHLFALLLLLSGCGPDANTARLVGDFKGIDQAVIMAEQGSEGGNAAARLDSIVVKRGSFTYEVPCSEPTILTLVYPNFSVTRLLLEPGKEISIKGDANRLDELEVEGSDDNNLLTEFRLSTVGKPQSDIHRRAASFVRSHPQSLAAVLLWADYFGDVKELVKQPALELLQLLQKAQPQQPLVQTLAARCTPQLQSAKGAQLPAFSARSSQGTTLTQQLANDRAVLISFSASWDGSGYVFHQKIRALQRKFKGRFAWISVSADADQRQATELAKRDSLPNFVFQRGALSAPLIAKFAPRYFPSAILVKQGGIIAARDVVIDDIERVVEQAFR